MTVNRGYKQWWLQLLLVLFFYHRVRCVLDQKIVSPSLHHVPYHIPMQNIDIIARKALEIDSNKLI